MNYQKHLYSVLDYERHAKDRLPKASFDYFSGAADDCFTFGEQGQEFSNIKLKQRIVGLTSQNKDRKSKLKTVFKIKDKNGNNQMKEIASPICITSTAFQKLADVNNNLGEVSVAQSCYET